MGNRQLYSLGSFWWYLLLFSLITGIFFIAVDLYKKLKNGENFSDLFKIHNQSSIFWKKHEEGTTPSLLELFLDFNYFYSKFRIDFFNSLRFTIIFIFLIYYCKWFVFLFLISFWIFNFIFIFFLFLAKILKLNTIIVIPRWKIYPDSILSIISGFFLIVYDFSFAFIYIILSPGRKPILLRDAQAFCLLILNGPLWYFKICAIVSYYINKILTDSIWKRKRYVAYPQILWSRIKYYLFEIQKTSYLSLFIKLSNRRIIIKFGKITLNGGSLQELFKREGLRTCMQHQWQPATLVLNKVEHQVFLNENGNSAFVATSKSKLTINENLVVNSMQIEKYNTKQFFICTYIKQEKLLIEPGHLINVFGKQGYYNFSELLGLNLRLNILYNNQQTDYILYQNDSEKGYHSLKTPLKLAEAYEYTNINSQTDLGILAEKLAIKPNFFENSNQTFWKEIINEIFYLNNKDLGNYALKYSSDPFSLEYIKILKEKSKEYKDIDI